MLSEINSQDGLPGRRDEAPKPRIAVIHDWILTWHGGSEKVLAEILRIFPSADVFALLEDVPESQRAFLRNSTVRTSFLQRFPGVRKYYRCLLPLMPLAIESLDVSGYDLVISSSHAVAKGVLTGPNQVHVCYCHSPIRYAWDLQHEYLKESGIRARAMRLVTTLMLQYLRIWDARTSNGVDDFLSNSKFVARRIKKVYGRESTVIHPPVEVGQFSLGSSQPAKESHEKDYVIVSRLVPYKRVALLTQAFAQLPGRRLTIVGDGPLMASLRATAPANAKFLGTLPFSEMRECLQGARAFLYAAQEDFGISMVEAQACGVPVIAYGSGGALETVIPGVTGILFPEQTVEGVVWAIRKFESVEHTFDRKVIRAQALRFSDEVFRSRFHDAVHRACRAHSCNAVLSIWAESSRNRTTAA